MSIQSEIDSLSAEERLALIEKLWDSLSDSAVLLTDAQREELDRRLEAFDQEKAKAVSWDQIKADLDARKR